MNCVCIVPGICKILFSRNSAGPVGKAMIVFIDIIALAAQISCLFVIMGTQYTAFIQKAIQLASQPLTTIATTLAPDYDDPFAESQKLQSADNPNQQIPEWKGSWETPFALILTSIIWWENYVDRDFKFGCIKMPLGTYKRHLQSVRSKANIGASLWKIALTITFSVVMLPSNKFQNSFVKLPDLNSQQVTTIQPAIPNGNSGGGLFDDYNDEMFNERKRRQLDVGGSTSMAQLAPGDGNVLTVPNNVWYTPTTPNLFDFTATKEKTADDYWKSIHPFLPFIIHFFSTGLCYYFAKSSCKMCMQRVAFALPLTLATPVTIIIYIGICTGNLDKIEFIKDMMYWECPENLFSSASGTIKWQLICGLGLWWLSELWICVHVWFPENKRLASTELLFILPQYCSGLIEQSLMLNRRRNEREHLKQKLEEHFEELDIVDGLKSIDNDPSTNKPYELVPKIYLCGTLWHETRGEMIQILKSIMRMDIDQSARRKAKDYFNIHDPDYYEVESHIFFDDAFEKNDRGEKTINGFVKELIGAMDKAASIVHDIEGMKMTPPIKSPTPYGGRLTWKLPGGNILMIHLKDKKKVLKRKRWSMIMYMYYLLGYRLLGQCEDRLQALFKMIEKDPSRRKYKRHVAQNEELHIYFKDVLGPKLLLEAENTFILSMDGDVDFGPDSVRMLVDRMKKNKNVGAACGRVHPIGTGPMIWFQRMEYALSYWLQKTTEHSLGCVLCAPGCFSLYRASSLMDDNVMRAFADKSTEPNDYIIHDLGEDRYLSRLLIQQGYKVEYCAASDAYTHAPETFTEYFNQRRRWIPSTLGNTVALLKNYRKIIRVNENVSFLCVLYHMCFLASYILSPSTITIAIADAFNATTDIDMWGSFILASLPAILFLVVCYQNWKEEIKIGFAAMLGTYYSILMMIVVVGTIVRLVDGSWKTTAVLFLILMAIIFFLTAFCHPFEIGCIKPCLLFFLCIPTSYILIIIYSLTNMNQLNWGVRDNVYVPQKRKKINLDENDVKELERQLHDAKNNNELIQKIEELLENGAQSQNDELLLQVLAALERLEMKEAIDKQLEKGVNIDIDKLLNENHYHNAATHSLNQARQSILLNKIERNDMINPYWLEEECLKYADLRNLDEDEIDFWKKFIKKYITIDAPMDASQKHKLQVALDDTRDRGVFAFFMLNALWIAFVFPILLAQDRLKDMLYIPIPIPSLYYQPVLIEPLGVLHLGFFAFIILTQFIAMLCHRYNTLQHILASTKLRSNVHEGMRIEEIIDTVKMLQQIKPIDEDVEPMPDYSDEEIDKISDDLDNDNEIIEPIDLNKYSRRQPNQSKNQQDGLRRRNDKTIRRQLKQVGQDNPAFIDDTCVTNKQQQPQHQQRSKSEDHLARQQQRDLLQNRQNRRSRRLQKKNSLEVQFRRRFSALRDGNTASFASGMPTTNNQVNGSTSGIMRTTSVAALALAARASAGNMSQAQQQQNTKKVNKMFNMHGVPVQPNVLNQKENKKKQESAAKKQDKKNDKKKNNKNNIEDVV